MAKYTYTKKSGITGIISGRLVSSICAFHNGYELEVMKQLKWTEDIEKSFSSISTGGDVTVDDKEATCTSSSEPSN